MAEVFLNGEYMPLEQARVSVEDRGFLFADGVYEVIRAYDGRLFHLDAHMRRLQRSIDGARLPADDLVQRLPDILRRVLADNGVPDTELYLQYTRGPDRPRAHLYPKEPRPTLLVMPIPVHAPSDEVVQAGVSVLTAPDQRWQRCDIKSTMLLPNTMAKQQARDKGAFEAVLVRDGIVTEGASTNFFVVLGDCVVTHPENGHILSGITRNAVIAVAERAGVMVREEAFSLEQVTAADEAFLTSTTIEVLPVTRVDERAVGNGRPGPISLRLRAAFQSLVGSA